MWYRQNEFERVRLYYLAHIRCLKKTRTTVWQGMIALPPGRISIYRAHQLRGTRSLGWRSERSVQGVSVTKTAPTDRHLHLPFCYWSIQNLAVMSCSTCERCKLTSKVRCSLPKSCINCSVSFTWGRSIWTSSSADRRTFPRRGIHMAAQQLGRTMEWFTSATFVCFGPCFV